MFVNALTVCDVDVGISADSVDVVVETLQEGLGEKTSWLHAGVWRVLGVERRLGLGSEGEDVVESKWNEATGCRVDARVALKLTLRRSITQSVVVRGANMSRIEALVSLPVVSRGANMSRIVGHFQSF